MKEQIKSETRDELINSCAALVTHIANKERQKLIAEGYKKSDLFNFEDLQTEGFIGLCKAADTFDQNKGAKFSTYAYYRIEGHIKDYARKEKKQMMAKQNALSEPVNDSDDFTDRIAASVDFKSGLKQLSEEEEKLLLTYVECSSDIDEAASLLDIPVGMAEDTLLRGMAKLKKAMKSTDRVWHDITDYDVLVFIWLKYKDDDPADSWEKHCEDRRIKTESFSQYREEKRKDNKKLTLPIPEDHHWFAVENPYFTVIVDPFGCRYSVIEMNIPEELREYLPDCLRKFK